ncbi:MAG: DUF1269 domain-containing protein [Methylococcales bacterium]
MSRIYFLAPDVDITHKIVDELRANSVEEDNIHIIARRGTPLQDLPESSPLQKSDIIPAMERALAIGGTSGCVFTDWSGFGRSRFAGQYAGRAGVGTWLGGMVGLNVWNTQLKPYEDAVEKGELLILLDIPNSRIGEITMMILKHHPEAEFEGIESIIPPMP